LLALFLITGCATNIHSQFEEAKNYALEAAAPVSGSWNAEAAVWLADDIVEEMILKTINDELAKKKSVSVSVATLTPTASLKSIDLKPDADCSDCLRVKLEASGDADWNIAGLKGNVPFDLSTTANVKLKSSDSGGKFKVTGDVTTLSDLSVKVGGSKGLSVDLSGSLMDWARERIVESVPTLPLVEMGGENLPARALRVVPEADAIRVELLTDAAHGAPLSLADATVPADGWQVSVAQETLLDLARRAAFQHGEVTEDVWAEPTSLTLSRDSFTLGLRIWKLSGMGWWRDYEITGRLALEDKKLALKPEDASEKESSAGAGLVDPLALLGQGIILDAIVDAAAQSFPLPDAQAIGTRTLEVSVDTVRGRSGEITASGSASLSASSSGRERGKSDDNSGSDKGSDKGKRKGGGKGGKAGQRQ